MHSLHKITKLEKFSKKELKLLILGLGAWTILRKRTKKELKEIKLLVEKLHRCQDATR